LKSAIFATFGPPYLDLGSGHTAYRHVALPLTTHTKFCWNQKNVLWTGVQTRRPALFVQLAGVDLNMTSLSNNGAAVDAIAEHQ